MLKFIRRLLASTALTLIVGSSTQAQLSLSGVTDNADTIGYPFIPLHLFYMSATGSDGATGSSPATAWASPNHAVHCGDVIVAASGTYTNTFSWGTVSGCPSTSGGIDGNGGVYFATILCAGNVGTCAHNANWTIKANNWAIEGWLCTGSTFRCYEVNATATGTTQFHHVAVINDIAFNTGQAFDCNDQALNHNNPGNGCDYLAAVGIIAQNAAQDSICLAAIDMVGMSNTDTIPGTHAFIYNNYAWANLSPACISKFDGEDFMFDTWDAHGFSGTGALYNNIGFTAARYGFQLFYQDYNTTSPNIRVYNNTFYDDLQTTGTDSADGEINLGEFTAGTVGQPTGWTVSIFNNIAQTVNGSSSGGGAIYAAVFGGTTWAGLSVGGSTTQNIFKANRASCNATSCNSGHDIGEFNSNTLGTNIYVNPAFTNATDLINNQNGAPSCTTFATTTQCLGWNPLTSTLTTPSIISDLQATCGSCGGKGFQLPSIGCAPNADYPIWLKGIVRLQWNAANSTITEMPDLATKPCGL